MITILLVDENPMFLSFLSNTLKSKTIKWITTTCVEEALNIIRKIKFDMIISSDSIGNEEGLSILNFLREKKDKTKCIILAKKDNSKLEDFVKKQNGIYIEKNNRNLLGKIKEEIAKLLL